MRNDIQKKNELRRKRTMRVRKHVRGSTARPRLCVVKSNKHIQAQIIDDEKGHTLASVATFSKEFKDSEYGKKSKNSAKKLGERLAEIASEKNIKEVVFDRGPSKFHGILAELANAARDGGLIF